MTGRFVREALALHAAYVLAWLVIPRHAHPAAERWATLVAMAIAGLYFGGLAVAFLWARKSRLNLAFAIQKAYWLLLVGALALPTQLGLIVHDAPYQPNPYALWNTPGWLRTYIWVFMSIAIAVVAREFFRANDLRPSRWRPRWWRTRRGDNTPDPGSWAERTKVATIVDEQGGT